MSTRIILLFYSTTYLCILCVRCPVDGLSVASTPPSLSVSPTLLNRDSEVVAGVRNPLTTREILTSIEDRLRGLDTYNFPLKLARIDIMLEQVSRRLETVDYKLERLETKLDVQARKLQDVITGKDIKEEMSTAQLSRRMENLNINFAFLDGKLDTRLEGITSKLELLEREIEESSEDIVDKLEKNEDRLSRLQESLYKEVRQIGPMNNEIKNIENILTNNLKKTITQHFETIDIGIQEKCGNAIKDLNRIDNFQKSNAEKVTQKISNITNIIDTIKNRLDNNTSPCMKGYPNLYNRPADGRNDGDYPPTKEQVDNLTDLVLKALNSGESQFKEIDSDVEAYTRKVVNSIYELKKSTDDIKNNLLETAEQGNRTRVLVREEFQKLHEQIEPLPLIEPKLGFLSNDLGKKVSELSSTVDDSFAMLLYAQNTFIRSCRRIQEEEEHLYGILEHVIYEMRNHSLTDVQRISEQLYEYNQEVAEKLNSVELTIQMMKNDTKTELQQLTNNLGPKNDLPVSSYVKWKDIIHLCAKQKVKKHLNHELQRNDYVAAADEPWLRERITEKDFNGTDYEYDNLDYST